MSDFNYFSHYDEDFVFESAEEKDQAKEGDGGASNAASGGSSLADMQIRSMAMGVVLTWVEDGDYKYNTLDELAIGVADLDGDETLTKEEEAVYDDLMETIADAMLSLGADEDNVDEALNDEDDDACEKLGGFLSAVLDNLTSEDDEIVTVFAEGKDGAVFESLGSNAEDDSEDEGGVFEAAYKKVKVVRNGKVQIKRKRISGKVRLSAAQKAGLKKARRKAHTSAARLARKKSNRRRKSRGM